MSILGKVQLTGFMVLESAVRGVGELELLRGEGGVVLSSRIGRNYQALESPLNTRAQCLFTGISWNIREHSGSSAALDHIWSPPQRHI